MRQIINLYSRKYSKKPIKERNFFSVLIVFLCLVGFFVFWKIKKTEHEIQSLNIPVAVVRHVEPEDPEEENVPEKRFVPGRFSMNTIKTRGCVADGILNGYGGKKKNMQEMIDRSECIYLHRALETWLEKPDFEKTAERMARFEKPGLIFGMFISEAMRRDREYDNPENGKEIDLGDMCKEGTQDRWGYKSCIPDIDSQKYRDYLKYITQSAMDIGIQSFMFGQIHLQDGHSYADSKLPNVIKDMRKYAKSKGLQIIIGAQTNSITEKKYLDMFDYIEGGVGIGNDGKIEDGPCWSRMNSCWALLWHDRYAGKAKNVLLHLDWSGVSFDDMSSYARLDRDQREEALRNLYHFFVRQDMGFMMPFLAPLYPNNGGCYGPTKHFYTPDNKYRCKDEDMINSIFNAN